MYQRLKAWFLYRVLKKKGVYIEELKITPLKYKFKGYMNGMSYNLESDSPIPFYQIDELGNRIYPMPINTKPTE